MEELIQGITPEVVDKELILDGTGENYRVKKLRYMVEDQIIDEVFEYVHPADHPAWIAVRKKEFKEGTLATEETYREWTISNHPVQTEIKRKIYLVQLGVTKKQIMVLFKMEHYNPDWTKAKIASQIIKRIGDDKVMFQYGTELLTEREYWERLTTEQAMTPYQLLDQRVPQMDADGIFNNY